MSDVMCSHSHWIGYACPHCAREKEMGSLAARIAALEAALDAEKAVHTVWLARFGEPATAPHCPTCSCSQSETEGEARDCGCVIDPTLPGQFISYCDQHAQEFGFKADRRPKETEVKP